MDLKKIAYIVFMLSVLVSVLWGVLGNGWNKSWIATTIGVVIAGILYTIGKDKK